MKTMKKILGLVFVFALALGSLSAQDTVNEDSLWEAKLSQGVGVIGDSVVDQASMDAQMLKDKFYYETQLQTQKFLKTLFIIAFIFMTLIVILMFFFYYYKIKQIVRLLDLQDRELKQRQFQIEKFSVILNYTMDAASIADSEGNIIWANNRFEKIFGVNPETSQEKVNIFDTSDPDIQKLHKELKEEVKPIQYTTSTRNAKGETVWFQRRIIPLINDKKEILNYAVIDTDLTALQLATMQKKDNK